MHATAATVSASIVTRLCVAYVLMEASGVIISATPNATSVAVVIVIDEHGAVRHHADIGKTRFATKHTFRCWCGDRASHLNPE